MHYPDPNTPIEETLGVLSDLVKQGKVRAIGHSNFSGTQIDEAASQAKAKNTAVFVTAQNEWSLLNRAAERDVVPACDRQHVGQLPYFPIANGLLTGKYRRGEALLPGSRLDKLDFFKSWANDDNFTKIVRDLGHRWRDKTRTSAVQCCGGELAIIVCRNGGSQ
jgi:aryl-alcohol dehydrogenase-like predicted oxidoreductase